MSKSNDSPKTKNEGSLEKKLDQLTTSVEQNLTKLIVKLEESANNNIKFVNLIQEDVRTQNNNMNYIEKKLEYIDKTMELKTKHFDEVIKTSMDNNDNLAKTVQANLHSQEKMLNLMEKKITSIKYFFIVTIVVIGGIMWGIQSHFQKFGYQNAATSSAKTNLEPTSLAELQENNHQLINNLREENKAILAAIQKDNKSFFSSQEKANREQLETIRKDTKELIRNMQKDNRELLTAIQNTNQEYLTTIINALRSAEVNSPTPSATPGIPPETTSSFQESRPETTGIGLEEEGEGIIEEELFEEELE